MADQPILELKNVHSSYGNIKALKGVSLKVYPGEIVAIIGANGAGKSTALMAISCVIPIDAGEIWYNGQPIHGTAAETLPKAGLCQVPEGRRIFPRLTVNENLTLGAGAVGYLAESMHGAGSPMAQRIMLGRLANLEQKEKLAERIAGVSRN